MELPSCVLEFVKASIKYGEEKCKMEERKPRDKQCFWQPWRSDTEDCSKQPTTKQLPTTKWKRDRRSRLPEYSRKSDPKVPEVFEQNSGETDGTSSSTFSNGSTNNREDGSRSGDTPLDMSIRHRGEPPSYAQTISNPGYRSSYRPSVIQNPLVPRDDLPSGISMCDPIIDEHFRRSLGNDYVTLFSNNNVSKDTSAHKSPPKVGNGVIELMDNTGLSVDDHFAKALGDTWLKLNKKEDIKTNATENQSMLST